MSPLSRPFAFSKKSNWRLKIALPSRRTTAPRITGRSIIAKRVRNWNIGSRLSHVRGRYRALRIAWNLSRFVVVLFAHVVITWFFESPRKLTRAMEWRTTKEQGGNIDQFTHLISPVPVSRVASGSVSRDRRFRCWRLPTHLCYLRATSDLSEHGDERRDCDKTLLSKFDPVTAIPRDVRMSGQKIRRSDANIDVTSTRTGNASAGRCVETRARTYETTQRTGRAPNSDWTDRSERQRHAYPAIPSLRRAHRSSSPHHRAAKLPPPRVPRQLRLRELRNTSVSDIRLRVFVGVLKPYCLARYLFWLTRASSSTMWWSKILRAIR